MTSEILNDLERIRAERRAKQEAEIENHPVYRAAIEDYERRAREAGCHVRTPEPGSYADTMARARARACIGIRKIIEGI